jgi:hypothetical protein
MGFRDRSTNSRPATSTGLVNSWHYSADPFAFLLQRPIDFEL